MAGSVANARKANTSGATSTTTTSFTGTSGNTIWVGVSDASGQGALTISDNVVGSPNTYTQIGTTRTSASGAQIRRFCCQNITGRAGMTVTATWGSNSDATVHVLELAGVDAASLDAAASAQADDSNPPWTVTSGTLAQADSIAVAMTGTAFNGTWSESSGFTVQTQEGDNNLYWTGCAASRVVAATTALTPSFTISGGGSDCAVAIDIFKAAAAGGGVEGEIAWTEADDVAALTGAAAVDGTAAWTEANDTAALTGAALVDGAAAWTEADDSAAIAGALLVDGSATWTEADDAAAITGDVGDLVAGVIAWAEADDSYALTGTVHSDAVPAPSPSGASGSAKIPRGWPHEQAPVSSRERKRRKREEEWAREQEAITERLMAAPIARITPAPAAAPLQSTHISTATAVAPPPSTPIKAVAAAPRPEIAALERSIEEAFRQEPPEDPRERIRARRKAEEEWIARAAILLLED